MKYYLILLLLISGCSGGIIIPPIKKEPSRACEDKVGEARDECYEQVKRIKGFIENSKSR